MTTQESAQFTDIDAYLSAVAGDAKTVKIAGKEWALAPALPAIIPLRLSRYAAEGQPISDDDRLMFVAALLGGQDKVEELLTAGVSVDGLDALLVASLAMYRGESGGHTLARLADAITTTEEGNEDTEGSEGKA